MADNGKATRGEGRESLRKVSISRIKKEMSDVFYLSDDLVIAALSAQNNTTADYPATIDGFSAIVMMTGEATVSIDMENYNVKPNTLVFFNPDSIIRTVKCSSNAAAYFLAFSKSFVNEIQIDLSTSLPYVSLTLIAAESAFASCGLSIAGTPARMRLPVSGSIRIWSTSGTCFTQHSIFSISLPPFRD